MTAYNMKKETGRHFMKRYALLLFVTIAVLLAILPLAEKKNRIAVAQTIAGEGMLHLVKEQWEAPAVALTFDDGPSTQYSSLLLDGLKERGVKVSFFLVGKNIEGNEEVVKRMYEEGHLIGNHTYNHVQLNKVSRQVAKEEIEKTGNKIYEITGNYPVYVRPPFGEWREDLALTLKLLNVSWSIDTLDWKTQNVDQTVEIVKKQVKDGSIILMHDGYKTSVEAALKIIDFLKEEGYVFVTVDKLLMV